MFDFFGGGMTRGGKRWSNRSG